ncbi:hypothetical protein AB4Y44_20650 [Paraburkholderia sp. BR10937]|uniref:hypothetical protein n=1 Tax=Paraburkholderia sp. BR10937 TaxID=3236994 RepID=UPI0034D31EF9
MLETCVFLLLAFDVPCIGVDLQMRAGRCDLSFAILMKWHRCAARSNGYPLALPVGGGLPHHPLVLLFKTSYYLLFGSAFHPVKKLSKTRDTKWGVAASAKIAVILYSRFNSLFLPSHSRGNPNRPNFYHALRYLLKLKRCFNH